MAIKFNTKLSLLLFLTLSLLLLPSHCHTNDEEEEAEQELHECLSRCERQPPREHQLSECRRRCVQQYLERKREEKEQGGGGDEDTTEDHHRVDPERQYKQCQSQCARQEGEQRQYCQQRCEREYERQKREQGREHGEGEVANRREREEEEETRESEENPYFFKSQRFDSEYRTQEGHFKLLERFPQRSELLKGLENYRLAVFEANPNTVVLPNHCDADSIYVVVGGKGTISYIWQNQRQSYNLQRGDVLRVPAGSIVYLVNHDDNEKLYIVKLLLPVNTPGRFKAFFSSGANSFYKTFSDRVLEAAFNIPREKLERLFRQQKTVHMVKASKEQIRALSQGSESSRGRKEESWGPFNLLSESPLFSNRYGQFFEAYPHRYQQLRDLDVSVGFMNIAKGAMIGPYYNSKSTRLVVVVGGKGEFEMACPHLREGSQGRKEREEETRTGVHYEKVTARFSVGDAFIVPAGHPIAIIASRDSNLQLAVFGIKGSYNQKYFLAGQENIWNQVHSEAKELAFNIPAREAEEIFRRQEQSYFLPGPGQREEGRGRAVGSILDFVGL